MLLVSLWIIPPVARDTIVMHFVPLSSVGKLERESERQPHDGDGTE